MDRIGFCLCVPLLLTSSFLCQADDPKPKNNDAPIEKVVATGVEAARKMDWKGHAELVHPESLQDYKNMWLPVLQAGVKKELAEQADLLSRVQSL